MPGLTPQRRELMDTLTRLGRDSSTWTVLFHAAIADRVGLNPTDHKCLDVVMNLGPMTAGKLAELTGLTTGAITGVVDRLENAGLARRQRDPNDRRQIIIQPETEAAERKLVPLFTRLIDLLESDGYAAYSDAELATIARWMAHSIEVLQAMIQDLRAEAAAEDAAEESVRR